MEPTSLCQWDIIDFQAFIEFDFSGASRTDHGAGCILLLFGARVVILLPQTISPYCTVIELFQE
jgi:hypothetical protein